MLPLLLTGEAVLSLAESGGWKWTLALTKNFIMQRVRSDLTCAAMGPQKTPRTNRVPELVFSLLFDLAALREKYRSRTLSAASLL